MYCLSMQAKLDSLLTEVPELHQPSSSQQQQQASPPALGINSSSDNLSMPCSQCSNADAEPANQLSPLATFQQQERRVLLLRTGEAVARMPGLGVYYSESSTGVPAVMKHVLSNMPILYRCVVFLTVRFVAVPTVTDNERFLAWRYACCLWRPGLV
jgi:hypothetical protein